MTRVEFYILSADSTQDRFFLGCRIAEKAWKSGHRVVIQTGSREEAQHMNQLLWTFREQSFIPHDLMPDADSESNPVLVNWGEDARGEHDVLINLAGEIPAFFSSFERVIEPVDNDERQKTTSREHYRFYRDRGYPLTNQEIKA
ncbi:hypothetical protein BOW52_10945 [Solemya elarraichensis gill symbiont]|uniref:DNA polymerase III subunit chi n=2 Tax=Solemya elarraichensis gill symbiont TaxID=1918949 RepID=A0A1T2KTC3_9GAMM|nr:hypothetical protein BOW52_10945 [Solemya elarraichensis gill symbiont]